MVKKNHKLIVWVKHHFKTLTVVFSTVFILLNFLFMRFLIEEDSSAFSHLMYIPIIILGSVHGSLAGLVGGLIAGLLVGPLMPYNIQTGEPQLVIDWVFRMIIMIAAGLVTGFFGKLYIQAKHRIKDMEIRQPDSGLYNMNYLRQTSLVNREVYTVASLIISNQETIVDVAGYEAYYRYLRHIEALFKKNMSMSS